MAEASSASGSETAARQLAATITRVTDLAAKLGRSPDGVLNPTQVHLATGVPVAVVETLLRGESAGEPDIQERFIQRLKVIRGLDEKGNKRKHSQVAIALHTGISRQQIHALINGDRRPTMDHCARIERFFGVPAGFLQSEDAAAVNNALLQTEKTLLEMLAEREDSAPSLPQMLAKHGVEGIAARAALLPTDQDREKVVRWLDQFMAECTAEADDAS